MFCPPRSVSAALIVFACLCPPAARCEVQKFFPEAPAPIETPRATVDDGAWEELPPPARFEHQAIYDRARNRFVVFGGSSGTTSTNDVWELTLGAIPRWTRLSPAGTPPSPRVAHTAIYDAVGDRMIVFGGRSAAGYLNDTWSLSLSDPPTWSQLTPGGGLPGVRALHAAVYDCARQRMLVFAGSADFQTSAHYNDVWALSLSESPEWTLLSPSGRRPAAREWPVAIYDPVRDRLVIFAGVGGSGYLRDAWTLSLAGTMIWAPLLASGGPPCARWAHSAAYDPIGDRMLMFGGQYFSTGCPSGFFNDTWSLSLSGTPTWSMVVTSGSPITGRCFQSVVFDSLRNRLIAYGGYSYDPTNPIPRYTYNDTWALSFDGTPAWSVIAGGPRPTSGRWDSPAIYDPATGRMLRFGGRTGRDRLNDIVVLPLAGAAPWTTLATSGTPPSPRADAAAAIDPRRRKLLVVGGDDGSFQNDVWQLSLTGGNAWTALAVAGTPPAGRSGHSVIHDPGRDRLVVFAGRGSTGPLNDVWALSLGDALGNDPSWSALNPIGAPPPRYAQAAISDERRERMLVFGGTDGSSYFNDVWELSFVGAPHWTLLTPDGTPPPGRSGHVAVYDLMRDRMVVFGGQDGNGPRNDVWALSLGSSPSWSQLSPSGAFPGRRTGQAALYDPVGDRMLITGGLGFDDTWSLTWGQPTAPEVGCFGDVVWKAGQLNHVLYSIKNRLGTLQGYEFSVSSERAWPTFPAVGHVDVPANTAEAFMIDVLVPDTAAAGLNTLTFRASLHGFPLVSATCDQHIHDASTPVLISLVSAEALPDRVRLVWYAADAANLAATVERREANRAWSMLADIIPDGTGRLVFEDQSVTPGTRYRYRLAVREGGAVRYLGEVSVDVPRTLALAIQGVRPNPAWRNPWITFTLPSAERATLELIDVSGRRVAAREVGGLGAGSHTIDIDEQAPLGPGIYLVRLAQGREVRTARVCVVR